MSKLKTYIEAGYYIAVCHNTNFDGHYTRIFYYPGQEAYALDSMCPDGHTLDEECFEGGTLKENILARLRNSPGMKDAGHYFLNRSDFEACLEQVYPLSMFIPEAMIPAMLELAGAEKTEGYVVNLSQEFFVSGGNARMMRVKLA